MTIRHPFLQAAALLMVAAVCAIVANAAAPSQRKLVLVGTYPNALRVPARTASPVESTAPSATPPSATLSRATPEPRSISGEPSPVAAAVVPMPKVNAETQVRKGATPSAATPIKASAPRIVKATPPATATTKPVATPPAQPPAASSDVSRFAPHPDKAYVEIGGGDVAALHAARVLFLDARRTSVYEQGHISGSRSVSVWESDLDEKVRKLFDERSDPREQAKAIVIYCSGGDCEDSHMLAEKLWGIQFNNLYVYKDGFPDWQKRGGTVHTGSNP